MCYLNHFKQCKLSAKRFLNYSNHKFNSTLGFTTHVNQNANNAIYLLNHVTHKTINGFCFTKCKHNALSAMC